MHSIKGSAVSSQAIKIPVARQNGQSRAVIHWLYPDPSQDRERCRTVVITAQVGDYKGPMLRSIGESVSGFNGIRTRDVMDKSVDDSIGL
jgi:hypothetical protein